MVKKILNTLTIRQLKNNFTQYIAVIIISFLAITLFVGLTSSYKTLEKRVNDLYEETNMYDLMAYTNLTEEQLNTLDVKYDIRYVLPITINEVTGYMYIVDNPTISLPKEGFKKDEVYISETFINYLSDDLTVKVSQFSFEIPSYNVMYHPEALVNGDSSSRIIYLSMEKVLEYFGAFSTQISNYLNTILKQVVIKTDEVEETILKLENLGVTMSFKRSEVASDVTLSSEVIQSRKLTYVFPIVFFLTSLLIIITTSSQMIYRDRKQIGCMKSLGLKNKTIMWFYIKNNIILCMIGSILGFIVGPILIPKIYGFKFEVLYKVPHHGPVFPFVEGILALLLLVGISTIVAIIITKKRLKLQPSEALLDNYIKEFKKNSSNSKVSWSLKIALRNIFQKPSRAIMVVLGLMGCSALLVVGYGIMDTINYSLNYDMTVLFKRDIHVTYNDSESHLEELNMVSTKSNEYGVDVCQISKDGLLKSTQIYLFNNNDLLGFDISDNSVVLSKIVAEKINANKDDSITLISNNKTYEYKVLDIIESSLTNGVFMINNDDFDIKYTNAYILGANYDDISNLSFISNAETNDMWLSKANDTLSSIRMITITLKAFAYALAIVVLYNLALLNFKERTRDLATMKVLGLRQGEIEKTVLYEMMILTILGVLLGLCLSMPLLRLLLNINKTEVFYYNIHIFNKSFILGLLLTILTSFIVNYILCKYIKKIPMVESLKSVE